jgi:hypothetical protein
LIVEDKIKKSKTKQRRSHEILVNYDRERQQPTKLLSSGAVSEFMVRINTFGDFTTQVSRQMPLQKNSQSYLYTS